MSFTRDDIFMLLDEFRRITQAGGNPFQRGGGITGFMRSIVDFFSSFFMILFYAFVAYIIYVILTKGYPRFIIDLPLLSFFHRTDVTKVLSEKDVLYKHYETALNFAKGQNNVYRLLDDLVVPQSTFRVSILALDDKVNVLEAYKNISNAKDRFMTAMRDFYTNYTPLKIKPSSWLTFAYYIEEILDPNINPEDLPQCPVSLAKGIINSEVKTQKCPAPLIYIRESDWNFYTKYCTTSENSNPSELQILKAYYEDTDYMLMYDSKTNAFSRNFLQDRKVKKNVLKEAKAIDGEFENLRVQCKSVCDVLKQTPFTMFITIWPEEKELLVASYNKYVKAIWSNEIYTHSLYMSAGSILRSLEAENEKVRYVDSNLFFIVEVLRREHAYVSYESDDVTPKAPMLYKDTEQKYKKLEEYANQLLENNETMKMILGVFMATPINNRYTIFSMLSMTHRELISKADSKVWWTKHSRKWIPRLAWFEKHPIFSSIFFNSEVKNKPQVYARTINAYETFMSLRTNGTKIALKKLTVDATEFMNNLHQNAFAFKELMMSIMIMDLYLNEYSDTLINILNEQRISQKDFFEKIWRIYFTPIWEKRIVEYYERIFAPSYTGRRFNEFLKIWKMAGQKIKDAKREVSRGFVSKLSKKDVEVPPVPLDTSKPPKAPPQNIDSSSSTQ